MHYAKRREDQASSPGMALGAIAFHKEKNYSMLKEAGISYRANKEHPGRLTEGLRFGHRSGKSGQWGHSLEGHVGTILLPLPAFASQLP